MNSQEKFRRGNADAAAGMLAALVESSDDAIYGKTLDGIVTHWNAAAERLYGYSAAEIVGQSIQCLVPSDRRAELDELMQRLRGGERVQSHDTVRRRKDGTPLRVSVTISPIRDRAGALIGASAIARDISDRLRAQEALRTSEEQLRIVTDHAPLLLVRCDREGRYRFVNRHYATLFGKTPEQLEGRTLGEVLGEDVCRQLRPSLERTLEGESVEFECELPSALDGSRIMRGVYVPERNEAGVVIGWVGVISDVTERRQIGHRLQVQSQVLDSMVEGVCLTDERGVILYTNPAQDAMYRFRPGELLGTSIAELNVRIVGDALAQSLDGIFAQLRSHGRWQGELLHRRRDETTFTSATRIAVMEAERRPYWVWVQEDVTELRDAAEQRAELEQRFSQLAENLAAVFYITDSRTSSIRYVSSAYERIWGRTCQSLYADPSQFLESIHADDGSRVRAALARQRQGENTVEEYRIFRPDGTVRWVWDRAFPVRDADDQVIRIAGIAEDITERKRIEQDLRFLSEASRLLASLVDYEKTLERIARLAVPLFADRCAIHLAERDGSLRPLVVARADARRPAQVGDASNRLLPAGEDSRELLHVFHTGRSKLTSDLDGEPTEGGFGKSAAEHQRQEPRRCSAMYVPLRVRDQVIGVFTFLAAESGRRYTSADLAIAEDLAHRAGIAIENARLYAELQAEGKRKDEFLAMLAHELRNPLAPIRTGLDVLRLTGPSADVLETMQQQTEHLVRLVDDLLDISRILRNKVELRAEPVKLSVVLRRAFEAVQSQIDALGHQLRIDLPPTAVWIQADPVRLAQVFTNLLQNAAKYTEPGGRIWVKASLEGNEAIVEVGDTGIGIDRHLLPYVFQPFAQADRSLERSQGGLGIGLTLVKSLVEMHGGTVYAMSEGEGKGSRFTIRLPALANGPAPARRSLRQAAADARRILVVDDNIDAAKMLAMLLGVMGEHEIHLAHDGPSALETAQECHPELVLLDIGLPGMNGYELATRMRADPKLANVLLVAVTGYGTDEDQQRSREAGFDLHLVKPLPVEAFEKILTHPRLSR